jgi:hypothetical protein
VTLEEAKQKYAGEWIAFLVKKENDDVSKLQGEVIAHTRDRKDLHRVLRTRGIENVYVTYAGPPIKPGYEIMLSCDNH